jgi:His-Xaa-Ser system protein HxsD
MENMNCVRKGEIIAYADCSLFSKETVLKCLYWYGNKFHINVGTSGNSYVIQLKPMADVAVKEEELEYYLQKLERDLVDFQLRDIVNQETRNIRDLLVAKAFSNGEFDEVPPGEVSDSIGFSPSF